MREAATRACAGSLILLRTRVIVSHAQTDNIEREVRDPTHIIKMKQDAGEAHARARSETVDVRQAQSTNRATVIMI